MRGLVFVLAILSLIGVARAEERMRFHAVAGACAGCALLIASGPIDAQAADRLASWLAAAPKDRRIVAVELRSAGGHLMGALRLGRMIRAAGLATQVTARPGCRSACAYAFLGGVSRHAEPGTLGLHAASLGSPTGGPSLDLPASARRIVAAILKAYVDEMGADGALVDLAFATPPDSLRRLDRRDLSTFRIDRQ